MTVTTLLSLMLAQSGAPSPLTPLITAGGALLGVIIGGLLNWFIQGAAERRRQQAEARAGVRLIDRDLRTSMNNLEQASTGYWPQGISLPTDAWRTYRAVLAITLEPRDWQALAEAVSALDHLNTSLAGLGVGTGPQGLKLPPDLKDEIAGVRGLIESALKSCERLQHT